MESSARLLAPFDHLITSIRSAAGLPERHWLELYSPVVHNYAALCQRLPASEAHHHAELGGLLRHGLETISEALILRRSRLLPPGAPAEEIASQQDLWTYATATSALLHDVGKPITDLVVTCISPVDTRPRLWQPLTATIPMGCHYRFRFNAERQYHRHTLMPPLLAHRILPLVGLNWLASEPAVFDAWLATISGNENAGPLALIAHEADGTSVARDLSGGIRTRSPAARVKPVAERLLTGLRHMVREGKITLNRPGASGFVAEDSLWLVSKRVLDELREHLTREGQTGIPGRNDRLMDELQQWHVIEPNGDKAVWFCDIRIGDWQQTLSCLRVRLTQIWPDPKDGPTSLDVAVTPTSAVPDPKTMNTPVTAEEASESMNYQQTDPRKETPCESELPSPCANPSARSDTDSRPDEPVPAAATQSGTAATISSHAGPAHAVIADGDDTDIGTRFVEWLKDNIREQRIEINTARARVHRVPEGLALITPGIFRDFSPEHWDRAQKRFQKLKLHAKTDKDTNIWTCQVAKDRRSSTVKVMLIPDAETALGIVLPEPNPVLTLVNVAPRRPVVGSETLSDMEGLD